MSNAMVKNDAIKCLEKLGFKRAKELDMPEYLGGIFLNENTFVLQMINGYILADFVTDEFQEESVDLMVLNKDFQDDLRDPRVSLNFHNLKHSTGLIDFICKTVALMCSTY